MGCFASPHWGWDISRNYLESFCIGESSLLPHLLMYSFTHIHINSRIFISYLRLYENVLSQSYKIVFQRNIGPACAAQTIDSIYWNNLFPGPALSLWGWFSTTENRKDWKWNAEPSLSHSSHNWLVASACIIHLNSTCKMINQWKSEALHLSRGRSECQRMQ